MSIWMIYITELLLYLCFAVLVGGVVLRFVPDYRKPPVEVSDFLLRLCILGIVIFSFVPILRVTYFFAGNFGDEFIPMLLEVSGHINVGQAWIWTAALGSLALFLISARSVLKKNILNGLLAIITGGLLASFGWASHSSSILGGIGWFANMAHMTSIMVWLGILFTVGWLARDSGNWANFLEWFSPVAMVCAILAMFTGMVMTDWIAPEYMNSWMLSYGQALLVKHLLLIPLLSFALINGVLMRRRLQKSPGANPLSWVKVESVIALLVFSAAAVMNQQTPPHEVSDTLRYVEPSLLFTMFYPGKVSGETSLALGWDPAGVLFGGLAVAGGILTFACFFKGKRMGAILSVLFGVLTAFFAYLALMMSLR